MKKMFTLMLLLAIGQLVTAQTVTSTYVNWKDMVAWEKAHPELLKPCKTCPSREADEGWEGLNNPNMPFPPGATIKKLDNGGPVTNAPGPILMAPSRPPAQDWLGHTDPGTSIPPDTHGAVGLNHVITATNDFIKIHNKVGGAQVSQVSISTFTAVAGTCDPYMIYDPTAQRWIFSAINCSAATANPMILMVSNTSDPTGTWRKITWVPAGAPTFFLDHPYVGFDANTIVLSGRRFPSGFAGPSLFLIDKAAMYAGTAITFGTNAQQIDKTAADGDAPCPVTVYDPPFSNTGNPSPGTIYILQSWNGTSIRLSTVTGTIPTATWNTATAVFPSGGTPWNAGNLPNSAEQMIETRRLAANDARISSGVMMNGKIWCAHHIAFPTSGTPDRIAVQWWKLEGTPGATFGNVLQQGRVGGNNAGEYKWFPAIAVNKDEDVLIGYTASTTTTRVGAAYVTRQASTAANTTDDELVYHAGVDRYWKDFGSGRARWGDYSHSSLDPVDNSLWTVQEYASTGAGTVPPDNNSRYGVWWAQVPPSNNLAPVLIPGTATITSESCLPANGRIDPNETVTISFCLSNTGTANTANLVGTLQATGGVTAPSGPQNYGVVVAGGPAVCRNFTFTAGNVACGATITASIQLQDGATNYGNITYNFSTGPTCCTPCIPASVATQPTNTQVCPTGNASFTTVAGGSGPFTYQWQESTTGAGGPWNNITNGGIYGGATSATLTLTGVTAGMNGYQYRVLITGACGGAATSNPGVLSVVATTIGGTVTPANTAVCVVPNTGVLTLSGHQGSVLRWESATNIAGPYTPIANTTTTLTFNNITVTTYFRAVVQAAGCVASNSSIATVTATTNPLVIVAVPGTTLCQGDPAALTVYESTGNTPVTLTQSTSTAITQFNSVSCNAGGLHTDNSYWRAYDLSTMGLPGAVTINNVTFGIEQATGGPQPVTVNLYTQNAGPAFPGGTRTLVGTQNFSVPNQALSLFTGNFATPVVVPNTAVLIVELFTPSGQATGMSFFIGSNAAAQTGPSYISAAACGIANPTDLAAIGFPNMHIILNLGGVVPGNLIPLVGGTFLWSPAAGLSSTTTNPVAASPAVTTTYTVTYNSGVGCVRTANVTLTVNQRPTVTTQPANTTVCSGSTATFTVAGTGTGLAYQWQVSTTGPGGPWTNLANAAPYSGVNTATLTINPTTVAMNNNRYRCVLTGTCPPVGTANISVGALLTVNALPNVTVTPATGCGGIAGTNGLLLTASGATSYTWAPLAGLYTNTLATTAYTGGNTATVYAAPTSFTAYTVTGTNAATGCINTATALINYTPPAPTVTPSAVAMCLGDPAVLLKSSSSTTTTLSFPSGTIHIPIGDSDPAGTAPTNLTVSGVPAGATISSVSVTLNVTHTYIADMTFNLKAPNGQVLNLDKNMGATGNPGANFTNTVISSAGTAALSGGAQPYTATFKADLINGGITPGYTFGDPTGYPATAPNWAALYSVPNGTWTLAGADDGAGDVGFIENWTLKITYVLGVPATPAVWSPAAGLFSNASATTPYVAGTPVDSVWARPTPAGVYPYQVTVQSLPLPPSTVVTPMAGGNGNNLVAFNVRNNNTYPITFTGISSNAFGAGAVASRVFYKAAPIAGNPGAISAANGWNQFGGANNTVVANVLNPLISGLTLVIPPATTYGIALDMTGATFPAYTNGTGTIQTYSSGGVDIITDGNVGWGGPAAPGTPANNPRNFNGSIDFIGAAAAACTSPARTVVVTVNSPTTITAQPANQVICTDKVATFSVTAGGTGPFSYQWQVSTDNGNTYTNISNGGVYSGATSATLTITAPPVSMNGYFYRAVITGAAPCASAISAARVLTVNPLPIIVVSANPYTRLFPGLTTILTSTVTPNAAGPGGYTWLRNGAPVAGATTGTLNVTVDALGDYQLRVTDVNGCTNLSNIVSIKDSVSGRCFIYPNPSSGIFQVRYYSALNNTGLPRTLTVYDSKGDRVLSQYYTIGRPYDRMDVDMRKYGKGVYWVEVGDVNGNRLTMCRIVIQ